MVIISTVTRHVESRAPSNLLSDIFVKCLLPTWWFFSRGGKWVQMSVE